jgi:predicted Zn finger-like uncharacterized protein
MIVNCTRCKEKMRVDESRIPPGEKVKIRCPMCGEVQPYKGQSEHLSAAVEPSIRTDSSVSPRLSSPDKVEENTSIKTPEEFTIPADAFQDFRFPAERGAAGMTRKQTPKSRKGFQAFAFVLISLGVIAVFALIVNMILPGPAGKEPGSGMPQWEDRSGQRVR